MRDLVVKGSGKPVKFDMDLSFVNNEIVDLDRVQEMVDKVGSLTEQVISSTLASGENTHLLIALFLKLQKLKKSAGEECQRKLAISTAEIEALNRLYIQSDQESEKAQKHLLILLAEMGRSNIYQTYGRAIDVHQNSLKTMTDELFKLYKRQKKFGSEFTTNPENILFLVEIYPKIEESWKEFRKACVLIKKEEPQVANMEKWQGHIATKGQPVQMSVIRDYRAELGMTV